MKLDKILVDIFQQDFIKRLVFDKVVLATTQGEIIFQQDDSELHLTRLDTLLGQESNNQKTPSFELLSRSTNTISVNLSGQKYQLFIQPCCSALRIQNTKNNSSAPDPGWVVCGLVSEEKLTYGSLAISFSLMAAITAMILLAVFSWPFLKLVLIGEHQRVRIADVWLVFLCGLLIISLVTISWLDLLAYAKLNDTLDHQLKSLSSEIQTNLGQEIRLANQQMESLCDRYKEGRIAIGKDRSQTSSPGSKLIVCLVSGEDGKVTSIDYPLHETISYPFSEWYIINRKPLKSGGQTIRPGETYPKCAWDKKPTPGLSVRA